MLADTFGDDDEDSDAEDGSDDRQRLMRGNTTPQADSGSTYFGRRGNGGQSQGVSTTGNTTQAAPNAPVSTSSRTIRGAGTTNDGVFANLAAKPERGEKTEDLPPVCFDNNDYAEVSRYFRFSRNRRMYLLTCCRHTNKPQLMPPPLIGRQPSSLPACLPTKSMLMAYLSVLYSHLSGTA